MRAFAMHSKPTSFDGERMISWRRAQGLFAFCKSSKRQLFSIDLVVDPRRMFQTAEENGGAVVPTWKFMGYYLMETHVLWMIGTSMQQHPTSLLIDKENSRESPRGDSHNIGPQRRLFDYLR